jgi:mannan endo-1,4-beta-mannosidase
MHKQLVGVLVVATVTITVAVVLLTTSSDPRKPVRTSAAPTPSASAGLLPRPSVAVVTSPQLKARDPDASVDSQAVYQELVTLEADARARKPTKTILGEHIEAQNELYNPLYGDYNGTKPVGYYYQKVADLTGKLPGFVEGDLGPGYDEVGWGIGDPRWYDRAGWPSCRAKWTYTDAVTDLLFSVWNGYPRAHSGIYGASAPVQNCDGSTTVLPDNGSAPAGMVGMSFHEPYPGSRIKGYDETLCDNSPAAQDPGWFSRVVDYKDDTPEYKSLLVDLSYLADHLEYFAADDVPVLLRPYHEMNTTGCGKTFWWAGQKPSDYVALWRITYNYLVTTRHLHNLLFVWAPVSWDGKTAQDPTAYYPGSKYVDVVAVDDYSDTPSSPKSDSGWTNNWYRALAVFDKPRMMAESYYMPINSLQSSTLRDSPWVIWSTWGDSLTDEGETGQSGPQSGVDAKLSYSAGDAVITGGGEAQGSRFDWWSLQPGPAGTSP